MGTRQSSVAEALFTKSQRRILGMIFCAPERSYYANEIVRGAGVGIGAALRELDRLTNAGILVMARIGNQKHFQANRSSPVFEELRGIARKLLADSSLPASYSMVPPGARVEASRVRLARICRKYGIRKLSLFGSTARQEIKSTSDVDLLVEFAPESRASLFDFPAMQSEFSDVFGHRRVDLVPPEVLRNPYRRKAILADLKVLYEAK